MLPSQMLKFILQKQPQNSDKPHHQKKKMNNTIENVQIRKNKNTKNSNNN